jgi:hypothetical protein
MFVVAAAYPAAVDALTIHLESHDAEHFAIGGILATILLMWTLIGCGSGRSWTVTLTATSMSSLTFTALLAVVTIVEAGFMTEEMDPDSCSYHEAIITLVIGASWMTHLALSIHRSARESTRRRILSIWIYASFFRYMQSRQTPRGPSDDTRQISWTFWPGSLSTAWPQGSSVLARSIASTSSRLAPPHRYSCPT